MDCKSKQKYIAYAKKSTEELAKLETNN